MRTNYPSVNIIQDPNNYHAEILNTKSLDIWQTRNSVGLNFFKNLVLPDGFVKLGMTKACMDKHYFRKSPDSDVESAVSQCYIGSEQWVYCAKASNKRKEKLSSCATKVVIEKEHTLIYNKGKKARLLVDPIGFVFIQVSSQYLRPHQFKEITNRNPNSSDVPFGWRIKEIELSENLTINLPSLTESIYFENGECFQGPCMQLELRC